MKDKAGSGYLRFWLQADPLQVRAVVLLGRQRPRIAHAADAQDLLRRVGRVAQVGDQGGVNTEQKSLQMNDTCNHTAGTCYKG